MRALTAFALAAIALGPCAARRADAAEAQAAALANAPATVTPVRLQSVRLVYRQVEGAFLKGPRGVFVDAKRGQVYVADTQNDLVAVFDLHGQPLFAFGYNGEIKEPIKAVPDDRGRIYVLAGQTLRVFNYRGESLGDFPFYGADRKPVPTALTAHGGQIYVADSASAQILVYDSDQRLRRRLGDEGSLKSVTALAVAEDGTVYVADARAATTIQVYGGDGRLLRGWGQHETGPQNFSLPSGIAVDGQGRVITVDMIRQQISVFTTEGVFQGRFGGLGTGAGAVAYPSDIASDGNGRLYVVERQGNRLQIFEERLVSPARRAAAPATRMPDAVKEELRRGLRDVMKDQR